MTESEARAVRDQALMDTDRYMLPDYPITQAGRLVIRAYRQALRDWTKSPGFPDVATMPAAEDWSKYKPIDNDTEGWYKDPQWPVKPEV